MYLANESLLLITKYGTNIVYFGKLLIELGYSVLQYV